MRKTIKAAFLCAAILLTGLYVRGASVQELFDQGNAAYEQGRFSEAQQRYEEVNRQNRGGTALYYNLGNAYYRLGRLGKARLWYERAALLSPGDEDVQYNLGLVKNQLQEKTTLSAPFGRILFSLGGARWFFLMVNCLFFSILLVGLTVEREWIWWGRWVMGFLFLMAALLLGFVNARQGGTEAVVIEPRVEIRTGPGTDYKAGFVVPEGQKLIVFDEINGWVQVGSPDKGLKGWVRSGLIEPIEPPVRR
ncbi:MAG TPA: tetratricopeptide repeat protein [Elusimicrobiota bacterium]|nr:tetratricopeptide repeat protein [Elusimicrobiota bacterium]